MVLEGIPKECLAMIADYLPIPEYMNALSVSNDFHSRYRVRNIARTLFDTYNINRHELETFLTCTQGVISGSSVLKFMMGERWPSWDMDIFVPNISKDTLDNWIKIIAHDDIRELDLILYEDLDTITGGQLVRVLYLERSNWKCFHINIIVTLCRTREEVIRDVVHRFDFDFIKNALWYDGEWKLSLFSPSSIQTRTHRRRPGEIEPRYKSRENKYKYRGFSIL